MAVDTSVSKPLSPQADPPAEVRSNYAKVAEAGHSQNLTATFLRKHHAVEAKLTRPLTQSQLFRVLKLVRARPSGCPQSVTDYKLQPSFLRLCLASRGVKVAILREPFLVDGFSLVFEDRWDPCRRGGRKFRLTNCLLGCDKTHLVRSLKAYGDVVSVSNVIVVTGIRSDKWDVNIKLREGLKDLPSSVTIVADWGMSKCRTLPRDACFRCRRQGHSKVPSKTVWTPARRRSGRPY
ncbi:hypothetical protein BX666DRAFT_1924990 [Dichotomocladium elegans]|nr:hypothetical protein BX666DRAFT_1924990 [Dichotomocladium elegans]